MKQTTLGLALMIAGIFAISTSAYALDFDFTIIGDGGNPGTITGEIVGLTDNATSQPTDIIVTSIPTLSYISAPPDVYLISQQGYTDQKGNFTVSAGEITAFNYGAFNDGLNYGIGFNVYGFLSGIDNFSSGEGVYTTDAPVANVSFSPASSVPEPSQYGFFVALATGAFLAWRRFSPRPEKGTVDLLT